MCEDETSSLIRWSTALLLDTGLLNSVSEHIASLKPKVGKDDSDASNATFGSDGNEVLGISGAGKEGRMLSSSAPHNFPATQQGTLLLVVVLLSRWGTTSYPALRVVLPSHGLRCGCRHR